MWGNFSCEDVVTTNLLKHSRLINNYYKQLIDLINVTATSVNLLFLIFYFIFFTGPKDLLYRKRQLQKINNESIHKKETYWASCGCNNILDYCYWTGMGQKPIHQVLQKRKVILLILLIYTKLTFQLRLLYVHTSFFIINVDVGTNILLRESHFICLKWTNKTTNTWESKKLSFWRGFLFRVFRITCKLLR